MNTKERCRKKGGGGIYLCVFPTGSCEGELSPSFLSAVTE